MKAVIIFPFTYKKIESGETPLACRPFRGSVGVISTFGGKYANYWKNRKSPEQIN
jgi:hypothetical protein